MDSRRERAAGSAYRRLHMDIWQKICDQKVLRQILGVSCIVFCPTALHPGRFGEIRAGFALASSGLVW